MTTSQYLALTDQVDAIRIANVLFSGAISVHTRILAAIECEGGNRNGWLMKKTFGNVDEADLPLRRLECHFQLLDVLDICEANSLTWQAIGNRFGQVLVFIGAEFVKWAGTRAGRGTFLYDPHDVTRDPLTLHF